MPNAADLWKVIDQYRAFLITSHVRPDPDAIASEIALALYLEKIGKSARIENESPLPSLCSFLPEVRRVLEYPQGMDSAYDAVICLDAPDLARTGLVGANVRDVAVIVVDHHPYANETADFAWIDSGGSSTGEMLYAFMSRRRELIDADIATCLYAAMLTDTGRFCYANTGRRTLEVAADLVSLGASPNKVAESYYENVSDGQMRILSIAASRMRRAASGKAAYTTLSREDFERAGVGPDVAQELAELPRSLAGVVVGVLLRDVGGRVKVSLRSKGGYDVRSIAEHFGGGGHREASGFLLELPLAEAEIEVIRFLEETLR